jgi:hypothetical protein|tara:strand:- start:91 stop:210 length:120 start_codon:yes stop_codon:yes gene_type:complete
MGYYKKRIARMEEKLESICAIIVEIQKDLGDFHDLVRKE